MTQADTQGGGARPSLSSRRAFLRAAAASSALGLSGCVRTGRGTGETAGGILVVAVDGLRADHLGLYGYDRDTSPTLDALAEEGLVFRNAFASAPLRVPAHVSLLTGCQPWVARRYLPTELEVAFERRWRLPVEVPHLAVELLARGWATALFADHREMAPLFGLRTGFQLFVSSDEEEEPGLAGMDRRIQQWLRSVDNDRPFFGYVHLNDLERSWNQPDPAWERFFYPPRPELAEVPPVGLTDDVMFSVPYSRWRGGIVSLGAYEAAYDGHIRRMDGQLAALFDGLRAIGRYDDTTIVFVGSHGLQFGEAGLYLRAGRYSIADLNVPLIVRPRAGLVPGMQPGVAAGRSIEQLFSVPDLAPTLMELESLPVPWGTHGVSHADSLRRGAGGEPVVPPRDVAFASCGIQEGCALVGPRYVLEYLIPGDVSDAELRRSWFGEDVEPDLRPRARFYDRTLDPHPPLADTARAQASDIFDQYRRTAAEWIQTMGEIRRALHGRALFGQTVDADTLERLRAEGYLPKERIG